MAIPWGTWIRALEDHYAGCDDRENCGLCAEWSGHVAREAERRTSLIWSTIWVAIGAAAVVTIAWRWCI